MYTDVPTITITVLNVCRQCTGKPFGYLVIHLGPQTEARDHLKTDIFWENYSPARSMGCQAKRIMTDIRTAHKEEKHTQTENHEMEVDDIKVALSPKIVFSKPYLYENSTSK